MAQVISRHPVCSIDAHIAEYHEIVLMEDGTYTVQYGVDKALLTKAELLDFEETMKMNQAYEDCCDESAEPFIHWRTIEKAHHYIKLLDVQRSTYTELGAYHAPSECYRDAFSPIDEELDELIKGNENG